MRTLAFLFLFSISLQTAITQTFSAVPGPLLSQELALEAANECYIFFENAGADSLQLRWKKIESNFPGAWDIDLCDLGACYVGIPASGLMSPAVGTEQAYLKLIVQPGSTSGDAWLWFQVWEDGNPDNKLDVFFSVFSPGVTSTTEQHPLRVQLYPNPTSGALFLKNKVDESVQYKIFDSTGQVRRTAKLSPNQEYFLDIADWPRGSYFLQTNKNTYTILRVN